MTRERLNWIPVLLVGLALVLSMRHDSAASEVGDLIVFAPADVAQGGDLNLNFEAVKTAVDDNHERILAMETATRLITLPAGAFSLGEGGSEPRADRRGIAFTSDTEGAARIAMAHPEDYEGGDVKLTVLFQRGRRRGIPGGPGSSAGNVYFGVNFLSFSFGDLMLGENLNKLVNFPNVPVGGGPAGLHPFHRTSANALENDLTGDYWVFDIVRRHGTDEYNGTVIVNALVLEYTAAP